MRVLVLDGDPGRLRAMAARLRADGHAVDEVRTLRRARAALADVDYDGLLLSRSVVDGDALTQVADLRAAGSRRPILVVSSDGDAEARLAAMGAGADDVVGGPAPDLDEVALRMRKVLLRAVDDPGAGEDVTHIGRVTLVRARREVLVDGAPIALTPTQYLLFAALVDAGGRPLPAAELLDRCWDRNRLGGNPLPAQLTRLRRALGGALAIEWVRAQGHVLRVVSEGEAATSGGEGGGR